MQVTAVVSIGQEINHGTFYCIEKVEWGSFKVQTPFHLAPLAYFSKSRLLMRSHVLERAEHLTQKTAGQSPKPCSLTKPDSLV